MYEKLLIIISLLLISLPLSACSKTETLLEARGILATPTTEIVEELSTQATTSKPLETEKTTTNRAIMNEEKKENVSNSKTTPLLPISRASQRAVHLCPHVHKCLVREHPKTLQIKITYF